MLCTDLHTYLRKNRGKCALKSEVGKTFLERYQGFNACGNYSNGGSQAMGSPANIYNT